MIFPVLKRTAFTLSWNFLWRIRGANRLVLKFIIITWNKLEFISVFSIFNLFYFYELVFLRINLTLLSILISSIIGCALLYMYRTPSLLSIEVFSSSNQFWWFATLIKQGLHWNFISQMRQKFELSRHAPNWKSIILICESVTISPTNCRGVHVKFQLALQKLKPQECVYNHSANCEAIKNIHPEI